MKANPNTLNDDMTLAEALSYVLAQYDAPSWLESAVVNLAGNWDRMKDAPNYGESDHPEGYEGYCVCDECLRSS